MVDKMSETSETPIISVIIPFHNTENYIKESLDSVLNQTFKDIEVICINDKSTDNSLSIVEKYAKKDGRIKIVNLDEKSGQSTARNRAMEIAKGKYISFIDSDDRIDLDAYEKAYDFINEYDQDMVVFNAKRIDPYKKIIESDLHQKAIPKEKIIETSIHQHNELIYDTCVWNKLIKADFIRKNNFRFIDGRIYEDMLYSMQMYCSSKSVGVLPDVYYYWRIRRIEERSTTQKRTETKNIADRVFITRKIIELFKSDEESEKLIEPLNDKLLDLDFKIYIDKIHLGDEEYLRIVEEEMRPIVQNMDAKHFESLSDYDRMKYDMLMKGELEDLVNIIRKTSEEEAKIQKLNSLKTPKGLVKHLVKIMLPKKVIRKLKDIVY